MPLEFRQEELAALRDLGSSLFVPEEQIEAIYDRVIQRATASEDKPDSLFMLRFIRRASFVKKSSHRDKLMTLLGALQNSVAWSGGPNGTTVRRSTSLGRYDQFRRPR
jgi:hypothetical protein